ncbi:MAG: hypothetical protein RLZZ241_40 [Bacteroidota bacterium]|jgi:hypothetical protein
MFEIDNVVVSQEILKKDFVCNLQACKGGCCVDGNAGAPLEPSELEILDEIFPKVKPYLRTEGVEAIEAQGTHVLGEDGEWETPLINGAECAYVIFRDGISLCGIEAAQRDGIISWKKPVSCHLYPIRIREYTQLTAVNYHKWEICKPACTLGSELQVPVYKFVKEALIRKFGTAWYAELEAIAQSFKK